MENTSESGVPNPTQNASNSKMILVVVGVVVLLVLVGGAYAFKDQIKEMMMPQSTVTETTTASETEEQTPEPTAPPSEMPTSSGSSSAEEITMTATTVEVDYTKTGFSPKSVTIKKGQAVKFVNKSGSPMSVASDPHPTHTIYPELDQYKSTAKGKDEYVFTFTKVGTWGYHNHMNDEHTGTVIVTN